MKRKSLTQQCHEKIEQHLQPGDWVLDATLGNGHDTLFLAEQVLPGGKVFGFDVQQQAVSNTQERLKKAGYSEGLFLFQTGHEYLSEKLGVEAKGKIKLMMFNLGYLPSADKNIITQKSTTISALAQANECLADNGVISIMAYPGHDGGKAETEAVIEWCEKQNKNLFKQSGDKETSPVLLILS